MADFSFDQFRKDFMDGVSTAADAVTSAARETGEDLTRYRRFYLIGRDLFSSGAVSSHGGNLSECDANSIWITRSGTMLGHISSGDIIRTSMSPSDLDTKASMELLVHRAMYEAWAGRMSTTAQAFGTRAIVHAHSKHTVLRSLIADRIDPVDSEGKLVLGESVPVLNPSASIASEEVAALMKDIVSSGASLAVVCGHGPFAIADSLENAFRLISCLEYSSQLLTLLDTAKGNKVT